MNYLEELQRKRRDMAAKQSREAEMRMSAASTKESGERVAGEVARQSARTRTTTQPVRVQNPDLAKTDDIQKVIEELRQTQLATYLSGAQPTMVLTDQTGLGQKMQELADCVHGMMEAYERDGTHTQELSGVATKFEALSDAFEQALNSQSTAVTKAIENLQRTIDGKEYQPKITVKSPAVEVPPVDVTPITEAVKELKETPDEGIKLSDYYGQDEKTEGTYQYVGFVNPDGGWYIIANDMSKDNGSALRYKFGKGDYAVAWERASSFEYMLLNEAIDALTA